MGGSEPRSGASSLVAGAPATFQKEAPLPRVGKGGSGWPTVRRSGGAASYKRSFDGNLDRLRGGLGSHLGQHVGAVDFDRARADFQLFAEPPVGQADRNRGQDLALAPGPALDPAPRKGLAQFEAAQRCPGQFRADQRADGIAWPAQQSTARVKAGFTIRSAHGSSARP